MLLLFVLGFGFYFFVICTFTSTSLRSMVCPVSPSWVTLQTRSLRLLWQLTSDWVWLMEAVAEDQSQGRKGDWLAGEGGGGVSRSSSASPGKWHPSAEPALAGSASSTATALSVHETLFPSLVSSVQS